MATPLKLNTGGSPTGPKLSLRTSGAAGATPRVRLKGANGQPIAPKTAAPASPKTAAPANPKTAAPAAAAEAEAAKAAEAAAAAKAAEEAAAAKAAEEAAAAKAAEEAAAAQAAAEAEAARLAQEEYERQMEEYNRQMEEYNRQMAEFKAAEEAAAAQQAEAEALAAAAEAQKLAAGNTDAEEAKAKLRAATKPAAAKPAAKPAGAKPGLSVAKPKGAAKPTAAALGGAKAAKPTAAALGGAKAAKPAAKKTAPEPAAVPSAEAEAAVSVEGLSEEELEARDAYLTQLQAAAASVPIWRTIPFMVGCGVLVALAIGGTVYVMHEKEKTEKDKKHQAYIKTLLKRAQEINKQHIEKVADARTKGVDITCSYKDAKALLEVVVDPYVKGETGQPLYGGDPKGVANNAVLLLGLAAEQDDKICNLVFETLGEKCNKMDSQLFQWQLHRVTISDTKDINDRLRKLAATVSEKPNWNKKSEVLATVWECIGLRVSEKDVPEILTLLADEKTDAKLTANLSICLRNVLSMMDDPEAKAKLGDEIFTKAPANKRSFLVSILANACSPKALEFYKNELKDTKTWKAGDGRRFISEWGDDSVLDFVVELKESVKDDPRLSAMMGDTINAIFAKNCERTDAEVEKLLKVCSFDVFADTSHLQDIINKTEGAYEIPDGPEKDKLLEERKKLEAARLQKIGVINSLGTLHDHKWVVDLLTKMQADKDADVSIAAKNALEKVKANAVRDAQQRSEYKERLQ